MWWIRFKSSGEILNVSGRFGYAGTAYRKFKKCRFGQLSNHQKRLDTYMEPHIESWKRDHLSPETRIRIKKKLERIEAEWVDPVWAQGLATKIKDERAGGCGGVCRQCGQCKSCHSCTGCGRCGKYVRPYLTGSAIETALSQGAMRELGLLWRDMEIVNANGVTIQEMVNADVKPGCFGLRHRTEKWYFSTRNHSRIWYKRKADVTAAWLRDEIVWAQECDRAQADSFKQRHLVLVSALEDGTVKEWIHYQDRIIPRKDATFRYA